MHRFLILAVLCSACAPDLTLEPSPKTVRALWNPSTGTLPSPTNLVRDNSAQKLALPIDADLPAAEKEFRQYLNFLDGFPLQSTLTVPVSGELAEGTVPPALLMTDRDTLEVVRLDVSIDGPNQVIRAKGRPIEGGLGASFEPGRTYVYGLVGYETGASGALGEPLIADPAFYFVRSEASLLDHPSAVPGEGRAQKKEVAEALDEIRVDFISLFEVMASRGIPKNQVAVVGEFTTTNRPSVWFDPDASEIPIPNDILRNIITGKVEVPEDAEDDESTQKIKAQYNRHSGFSTSGALVARATGPVDRASVSAETVRLFAMQDGAVVEIVDVARGVLDDGQSIYIKPRLALEDGTFHVAIISGVTVGGALAESQPLAALLRLRANLVEDGKAQVGVLDDESAAKLEPVRLQMAPILDELESRGIFRESISAAIPFTTASAVGYLNGLRNELYQKDIPAEVRNTLEKTPVERGLPIIMRDVQTIVSGDMTILDHLDPATQAFRKDGATVLGSTPFVLTIPESATPGVPIPVVLFGHGLFTSRELAYMIANRLAQAGYAVFSMDFPFHGERTPCTQNLDCKDNGVCDELGHCILPDGSRGELNSVSSPFPNGPVWPAVSGAKFVDVEDISSAPDHFAQSVTDLCQALRVIRSVDWAGLSGGYVLDDQDVVYLGMSLGGIMGAILAGVEPDIQSFALNVAGANLFQLLETSRSFVTALETVLDERGIQKNTDEYFAFENALRWLLDPVDPLNVIHHATFTPHEYEDPDGVMRPFPLKRVIIQMAEGDLVVPNSSSRSLSERADVPLQVYTPLISNHAFLFDPTSLEGARARTAVVEFFDAR
jgi:pimeloyl-ACP methyl ester carboxylesterase